MSEQSESEVPHDLEVGQVLIKFDSSRWKVTKRMVDVDHEEVIYRLEESDVGPSMAFSELMTQDDVLNLYKTADGEPVTDGGIAQEPVDARAWQPRAPRCQCGTPLTEHVSGVEARQLVRVYGHDGAIPACPSCTEPRSGEPGCHDVTRAIKTATAHHRGERR